MSSDSVDAESKVSGNQASIPAHIRRRLDIEDGDFLRWTLRDDGRVVVEVVHRGEDTFADFEGYDIEGEPTDSVEEDDAWGLE